MADLHALRIEEPSARFVVFTRHDAVQERLVALITYEVRDGGLLETPEGQKPLKVFEFNKHTPPSVLAGLDPSRSASTSAAAAHPNHASASAAAAHPNQNRTPTAAKRHKLIQDFQSDQSNGGARVFIVTYATAAVGITLTAANRIFLMEPCPDPGQEAQAAGRIHRLGQTKEVFVKKYCFRESIEETIVKLHEKIKSGDVKIVDGKMVRRLRALASITRLTRCRITRKYPAALR